MANLCIAFSDTKYCVETGSIKFIKSDFLVTSFINTCCVLAFHVNGFNFLAHIDDMIPNMYNNIIEILIKNNDHIRYIKKVHIWIGSFCNNTCSSLQIANNVAKYIDKPIIYHKDNDNEIKIDKNL